MKKAEKFLLAGVGCLALAGVLIACTEDSNPAPDSDSTFGYADGSKIPVDERVYTVTGEVSGPINNLTRQVKPAEGSLTGSTYGSYGSVSGSFTGPIEAGKGFVRVLVTQSDTDLAPVRELAIVKTADTKVSALLPGDIVSFKCRRQYENVAAVKDKQSFKESEVGTWELDYCRMVNPTVQAK